MMLKTLYCYVHKTFPEYSGSLSNMSCAMLPGVEVYGVQVEAAPAAYRSFKSGQPDEHAPLPTIADGVAIGKPGSYTFDIIMRNVEDMFLVGVNASAMVLLIMERKGTGAVSW